MDEKLSSLLTFLQENKAKDVAAFDMTGTKSEQNFVVIANMPTTAENKALAEKIMAQAQIEDFPEGYNRGEWIIFVLDDILLHTFIPIKREKYNLDKLYQSYRIDKKQKKAKG